MKWFLLIFVLLGINCVAEGFFNKEMAAVECKTKHRVPSYDIENMKNRKMPESKEGKCMMACILKKLNVINEEGKFEAKTVKKWVADKYKDDQKKLTKAYARVDGCADQLSSPGDDECEYAAKLIECTKKKKNKKN